MKRCDLFDASSGICPLGPSRKVKAAIRKAVKGINDYPDAELQRLRRFFLSRYGFTEDSMLFAGSLQEIINLIPSVLRPKKVLVYSQAPDIYKNAALKAKAEVVSLYTDMYNCAAMSREEIKQNLAGCDLLFVSNPNRITGRLIDKNMLYEIVSFAEKINVTAVIDEAFMEFTGEEGFINTFPDRKNAITIRTTAYYCGIPGLELAYAVSTPEMMDTLKQKELCPLNNLSIAAAMCGLKDSYYKKMTNEFILKEKDMIMRACKKLDNIECFDSDSHVMLLKLKKYDERILQIFSGNGFLVRDCSDIKGLDKTYLRFSVMKHEYNLKFIRILQRCLKDAVTKLG